MGTLLSIIINIALAVFFGTFAGTLLWFFSDTVDKFLPLSFVYGGIDKMSWWECVRFGWVCTALFKGGWGVGGK